MARLLLLLALLFAGSGPAPAAAANDAILVYSGTTGYRHDSIPAGIKAIRRLAAERGLAVEASEDPAVFSGAELKRFKVVVLLSTTTDPQDSGSEWLTGSRATAFQAFLARGGRVLAIHAAADSHYHSPWYGEMIGGRFARHPAGTPRGRVTVHDPAHPAVRGLAPVVDRADEYYYFDDYDPRSTLLATLDPRSIGEADVNPNPVAWARPAGGGRLFYTAMGHTSESYSEPWFLAHLAGGLDWLLSR